MVKALAISMNGQRLGRLLLEKGELEFVYDDAWLTYAGRRSLSHTLPLTQVRHVGKAVESFFFNLLPDNPDDILKLTKNLRLTGGDALALLGEIGRDCSGAVQVVPEGELPAAADAKQGSLLSMSEIEHMLKNLAEAPLGLTIDSPFRLALAGAQAKTALLKTDDGWALPFNGTPTTHIFKAPMGLVGNRFDFSDSVENEWLCLEIARAFGLPTAKAEIARFGDQKALVVERFDRRPVNGVIYRLPTEDFCQALGIAPEKKYEVDGGPGIRDIMRVLDESSSSDLDRRNFMAMQVLLWLINSTDGHAKNYSIFIAAGDEFSMTPFYDVMSIEPLVAAGVLPGQRAKLAMGLIGKNKHYVTNTIQVRHFLSTAQAVGFPEEEMRAVLKHFADNAAGLVEKLRASLPEDFPTTTSEPIFAVLLKRVEKIRQFLSA